MEPELPSPPPVRERFPALYGDLREIAAQVLRRQSPPSVEATDLVHEAFLKLQGEEQRRAAEDRSQLDAKPDSVFKACFGAACRDVLADHSRRRAAQKRGGGREEESPSSIAVPDMGLTDAAAVHEALAALGELDASLAQLVEARVFGGMTVPECAELLATSPSTVDREWRFAVAWLRSRLG